MRRIAVMNREEMLKELKTIDLRAIPTVATMDMGLQYDYATSEGAGTSFGGNGCPIQQALETSCGQEDEYLMCLRP